MENEFPGEKKRVEKLLQICKKFSI